ncbi:MAG: hypothetical protein RLZZ507_800 [Cyanobacteriota bacterium]|jgi:hypothetical protein
MQLPSTTDEKHKKQGLQSGILVLSTLILANSAGFVKAEPPQLHTNNPIISVSSEYLSNVPKNTVAKDLLITDTTEPSPVNEKNLIVSDNSEDLNNLTDSNLADNLLSQENNDLTNDTLSSPVNNVSQFTDVTPQDWAYEALSNLIKNYNCISPYPDGTFKGNRSLTRYEFASILNSCLEKMQEIIAANTSNLINPDDLTTIQKLREDFTTELSILTQRIDTLEAKTAVLENNQFSTTTLIGGEVIFAAAQAFGGSPPGTGQSNAVINHLTRIQLVSSFTGKDRFRLELASGNFDNLGFANPNILNTNTALLSYQVGYNNSIQLSNLEYRFAALGDRAVFTIKPVGFSLSNVLSPNSPYFDTGRGAISRFAESNPIFKIGALDSGIGIDYLLNDRMRLQIAHGVSNGNNPQLGAVLGTGSHATGVQLFFLPGNDIATGLSYIYSYSPDGRLNTFTGSAIADASGFINQPAIIHAFGGTLQWRITPKLTFASWGGLTSTQAAETDAFAVSSNFMFSLGLSNPLGRDDRDLFAIMLGQQPTLVNANGGVLDNADSYHIETFYRLTVNDRISITPGFFLVTNPNNIEANNTIYVGVLRTTFRF